jgi:cytochrome-b5 reductase
MRQKTKAKSLFDLKKFFEQNPDPLGVQKNGGFKEYTKEEIAEHNKHPSIWVIYKESVYDITMFLEYHPGGIDILRPCFGKDMTELFNKYHSYIRIDGFIGKFKIGYIKKKKVNLSNKPKTIITNK